MKQAQGAPTPADLVELASHHAEQGSGGDPGAKRRSSMVAVYIDGTYYKIVGPRELFEIAEVFLIFHFDAHYREVHL